MVCLFVFGNSIKYARKALRSMLASQCYYYLGPLQTGLSRSLIPTRRQLWQRLSLSRPLLTTRNDKPSSLIEGSELLRVIIRRENWQPAHFPLCLLLHTSKIIYVLEASTN